MKHSEYQKLLEKDKSEAQKIVFNEYLNYVYTIAFNRLRSCGSREDIDECVIDIFNEVFASYERKPELTEDIRIRQRNNKRCSCRRRHKFPNCNHGRKKRNYN